MMKKRMKLQRIFAIAAAVFFLFIGSACISMPEGADPANGERWFRMNRCNGCHGENATGGIGPMGQKGPKIVGLEFNYSTFVRKLRNPNSAVMPAFSKEQISNMDAADIYLWLKEQ